jgi:hypothetical protein
VENSKLRLFFLIRTVVDIIIIVISSWNANESVASSSIGNARRLSNLRW